MTAASAAAFFRATQVLSMRSSFCLLVLLLDRAMEIEFVEFFISVTGVDGNGV